VLRDLGNLDNLRFMKARAAILAPKRIVEKGAWKVVTGTSRMPKNAFPVGSNYPVTFARNWHWRVDRLTAEGGGAFRLLTAYNSHIEEFRAWLAADYDRSATLLARFEFHGSHPGWHCHAPCDELERGDFGALRTRAVLRFPNGTRFHRDKEFGITSEGYALSRSFSFYRVSAKEGELL
jgi:hypothetical protein